MKKLSFLALATMLIGIGVYSCTKQQTQETETQNVESKFKNARLKSTAYKSVISGGNYVKIEYTKSNDTVYVNRGAISADPSVKSMLYNQTGIPFVGNSISIPSTGKYWFIPFESTSPVQVANSSTFTGYCVQWCCCQQAGGACEYSGSGDSRTCDCTKTTNNAQPCKVENSMSLGAGLVVAAAVVVML